MKKLLFTLITGLMFLTFPSHVSADCGQKVNGICPGSMVVSCSSNPSWCCSSSVECSNPANNQQNQTGNSEGSSSSGGSSAGTVDKLDLNTIQQNSMPDFKFTGGNIGTIISAALPYIFFFAGLALLIYIIIGGYRLMFSQGDPKAIADGKAKVTAALVGFIIIFTAFWIVQLVSSILGVNQIQDTFNGRSSTGVNRSNDTLNPTF